ncbi:MAG: AmmeMemoRadiSam system protein B [Magnetospirillum sp.]|nr:AmmeMemoRadiSam system protein B [Magnetospirillum sp.]
MTAIRPAAVAGMFYPADPAELKTQLDLFLGQARAAAAAGPVPKAIIAPHAGYIYSGPVAASAYVRLQPAAGTVSRVVLLGPSHRVAFRGMAVGTAEAWASPLGPVAIDREAAAELLARGLVGELDVAHTQEHSLEVHVPFLQAVLGQFMLLPIVVGDASADEVAAVIDAVWGGPETLIVVSTDLSHYLGYDDCRTVDAATVAAIERLEPGLGRDSACGRVPVGGLLVAAKRRGMAITTLDVRNSGDTAGTRERVVGYGAWALFEADEESEIRALGPTLTDLAWRALRLAVETGQPPKVELGPSAPARLRQPGAVFVTLKKGGALRGCIGSPTAWRPLAEDIADNAHKAALDDRRFPPVKADELASLSLSVSVLTPPVPMSFTGEADMLEQLRPRVDGLIIEDGGRRALFLPSVWEQLPDKRGFLEHLKAKAGMAPGHWSAGFKASRFQAVELT